jgi:small subunit ribosomal protein S14
MSQFRSKKLDIGGFINGRIIRDHTKRKVFEQYEPDRYGTLI